MGTLPKPICTPPEKEELAGRLAKVRALMESKKLDCYVSFDPVNIYYLTNFANNVHERPFILIVKPTGIPVMLCPLLELSHVKTRARCELEYVTYYEVPSPKGQNWYDLYKKLIDKKARVGIESALPVGIAKETPGTHVVDDIIDEVRLVKTEYEIARTIHACSVVDLGHEKLLEVTRPGVVEVLIYGEVVGAMMGKTLMEIPTANLIVSKFVGAVWPPALSHDPHIVPQPVTAMEEGGPHVSIVAAQIDGYGVEVERTLFLGMVPEGARKPFDIMIKSRAAAYAMLKPGAILEDIDRAARKVIIDAGYEKYILHRTGHGFGITGHEAPYVALGDTRRLEPGMIISIEPGIYIPGEGGYRHSDTVLITETGYERLTRTPDTLEAMTVAL
ncbi:MAG TPA: Xaa-Pro peptidase family protein [Spirochaetota bacterium]|nr:Xaa-Pro peptidase family protein [Spirochaetota bacterium]